MSSVIMNFTSSDQLFASYEFDDFEVYSSVSTEREEASKLIDSLSHHEHLKRINPEIIEALKELKKTILDNHDEYQQPTESELIYGNQLSILNLLAKELLENNIPKEQFNRLLEHLKLRTSASDEEALTLCDLLIALEFSLINQPFSLPKSTISEIQSSPLIEEDSVTATKEWVLNTSQLIILELSYSCFQECQSSQNTKPLEKLFEAFSDKRMSRREWEAHYESMTEAHYQSSFSHSDIHRLIVTHLVSIGRFRFSPEPRKHILNIPGKEHTEIVTTQQISFQVLDNGRLRSLTINDVKSVDLHSLPRHQKMMIQAQACLGSTLSEHFEAVNTKAKATLSSEEQAEWSYHALMLKRRVDNEAERFPQLKMMINEASSWKSMALMIEFCNREQFFELQDSIVKTLNRLGVFNHPLPTVLAKRLKNKMECLSLESRMKIIKGLVDHAKCWQVALFAVNCAKNTDLRELHSEVIASLSVWVGFCKPIPEELNVFLKKNLIDNIYSFDLILNTIKNTKDRNSLILFISHFKGTNEQVNTLKLEALDQLVKIKRVAPVDQLFLSPDLLPLIPIDTLKLFPETTRVSALWKALENKENTTVINIVKSGINPNIEKPSTKCEPLYTDDVLSHSKEAKKIVYKWVFVPLIIEATRQNNIELVEFLARHQKTNFEAAMKVEYIGYRWTALDIALNGHFDEIRDLICEARGVNRACELKRYQDMATCTIL